MRPAIIVALFCAALFAPIADGSSLTVQIARALHIAKDADRKATQALTATRTPGPTGEQGFSGPSGSAGHNGQDGANGSNGTQGPKGDQGIPGTGGSAKLAMSSIDNPSDVRVGSLDNITAPSTIATATINRTDTGPVSISADAELDETAGIPDTNVLCRITVDGTPADERGVDMPRLAHVNVSVSAAPQVDAGTHTIALVCQRSTGATDSVEVVPAHGARLTVLGG